MKAPTKISISERPPAQPSGVRDAQIKALRYLRDNTLHESDRHLAIVTLIAMGEQQ